MRGEAAPSAIALALGTQMLVAFWLAVATATFVGSFFIAAVVGWLMRHRRVGADLDV